jgi:hypothetical protein
MLQKFLGFPVDTLYLADIIQMEVCIDIYLRALITDIPPITIRQNERARNPK